MDTAGPKVIGLVGNFSSGTSTAAKFLAQTLHAPIGGLAEKLRQELRRQGIPVERENLRKLANELRAKDARSLGWLVIKDFESQPDKPFFVAEPIRSVGDYKAFKEKYGKDFILLGIDAPVEMRYGRAMERKREGEEKLTLEQFRQSEQKEARKDAKESEQNIPAIMALADYKIENNGTQAQLEEKLNGFVKHFKLAP